MSFAKSCYRMEHGANMPIGKQGVMSQGRKTACISPPTSGEGWMLRVKD